MEGGRRSLFYHPKGTILEEFLFITRQGGEGSGVELLVKTSLAHGGGESLSQRHHQSEHFRGLLRHHGHLSSVVAAGQSLDDGSHDRLERERER